MPEAITRIGRSFYIIGLLGLGLMHFVFLNFPGVILPAFPAWIPFRLLWVLAIGGALVAVSTLIPFSRRGREIAAWTGVALLALVLLFHIPYQLASGYARAIGAWSNTIKEAALAGGAWIVALSLPRSGARPPQWLERLLPAGRCLFAVLLITFGVEHFIYTKFVATLIPAWIGAHILWTCSAGIALIAGAIGLAIKRTARLAGLLTGIMLFLWVILLHIPRAIADPRSQVGNEWASVFEALAFSGMALMLAMQSKS